jgi:hypothetical protein
MATKTLLEIVQNILSDMDSDEVNSITDTTEAMQVAEIVRTTYDEVAASRDWEYHKRLFSLVSSGNSALPNYMKLPDDVVKIEFIKYNKRTHSDTRDRYETVTYKYPDEFIDYCNGRNGDEDNTVLVTDHSGIEYYIENDKAPSYYTSFNDEWVVFDSYDSEVDDTLRESKNQVYGTIVPELAMSNTAVPSLPPEAFPYLIAEAKSVAFSHLRQTANAKEEQKSRRQRTWLAQKNWRVHGGIRYPDYGRK